MKRCFFLCALVAFLTGCAGGDGNQQGDETGTLQFQMAVGADGRGSRAFHTCAINDVRTIIYHLWVSNGPVVENAVDDLEWFSILESDQEMLASQRYATAVLPVGRYENMKVRQRNRLYWVADCPSTGAIELPDLNHGATAPEEDSPICVVNMDGMWYFDTQDRFTLMVPEEKMGAFEIKKNRTTLLRWVLNFNTLDWNDADDSGTWTEGDELDNWTLVDGKQTMFDFVVEYLD